MFKLLWILKVERYYKIYEKDSSLPDNKPQNFTIKSESQLRSDLLLHYISSKKDYMTLKDFEHNFKMLLYLIDEHEVDINGNEVKNKKPAIQPVKDYRYRTRDE